MTASRAMLLLAFFAACAWVLAALVSSLARQLALALAPDDALVERLFATGVRDVASIGLAGGLTLLLARRMGGGAEASVDRAIGLAAGHPAQLAAACVLGIASGMAAVALTPDLLPGIGGARLEHRGIPVLLAVSAWTLSLVAVSPLVEELVFRGVVFAGLCRLAGPGAAALASMALFLLFHLPSRWGHWSALLGIALLALLATALRVRSGCLGPAIAVHAAHNAVTAVVAMRGLTG